MELDGICVLSSEFFLFFSRWVFFGQRGLARGSPAYARDSCIISASLFLFLPPENVDTILGNNFCCIWGQLLFETSDFFAVTSCFVSICFVCFVLLRRATDKWQYTENKKGEFHSDPICTDPALNVLRVRSLCKSTHPPQKF